jgi:hypothetical protein
MSTDWESILSGKIRTKWNEREFTWPLQLHEYRIGRDQRQRPD